MHANRYSETAAEYDNWYDWEIGAPLSIVDVAVFMYDALGITGLSNTLNALDHFVPSPFSGTSRTSQGAAAGYARTQYAYNGKANTINPALISPLAKTLFTAMPHATNQSVVPQSGQPNLTQNLPSAPDGPEIYLPSGSCFQRKESSVSRGLLTSRRHVVGAFGTNLNVATSSLPYGISSNLGGAPQINISSAVQYTHLFSPTFFAETVASQQWLNSF